MFMQTTAFRSTVAVTALLLSACAYNVQPTSAPAVNIYSSYEDKIPGRWAIVVDPSVEFQREIKPSSFECSAHKYPIASGDSIRLSVNQTLANIFDETVNRPSTPSLAEIQSGDLAGTVVVRLDSFQPRLSCSAGFWSASCNSTVDISFGVEVNGAEGRLLGTSVGSTKSYDGGAGGACGKAADVLAEAYRLSLRDALERMAERISNAPRLRAAAE